MKKTIVALALVAAAGAASAVTFLQGGYLMGTVCRNGPYYTDYAGVSFLPVGAQCFVRAHGNPFGPVIMNGYVTAE